MRKLFLFVFLLFSITLFCQDNVLYEMMEVKIHGFNKIRHDAIIKYRFRYAHYMKKQIQQSQIELSQLKSKQQ